MRLPEIGMLPDKLDTMQFPRSGGGLALILAVMLLGCGRTPDAPPPPFQEVDVVQSEALEPLAEQMSDSKLPVYELRLAPKDLAQLERGAFSNETVPGVFVADGTTYEGVRVRYRGAWARTWPKKPIKIFFDKNQRFEGQRCLNLNSGWHDPALVRECLAYHVYAACGVPAPRSRMVRLNLNGKFHGAYVEVEQPEQGFVQYNQMKGAASFKANSRSNQADERDHGSEAAFRRHYEKQTVKSEGYAELQHFCQELARTKDVRGFFEQHVDIEKYINYLAATVLVQNWDAFNKNHYLIYDRLGSKKWFVTPWDLDRTFGDHWEWSFDRADLPIMLGVRRTPGVTGWNRLQDRFLSDPEFRKRFLTRLAELLEKEFTTEKLFPVLDKLESDIGSDADLDRRRWSSRGPGLHGGIAQVKRYIERRRAYLLAELNRSGVR